MQRVGEKPTLECMERVSVDDGLRFGCGCFLAVIAVIVLLNVFALCALFGSLSFLAWLSLS